MKYFAYFILEGTESIAYILAIFDPYLGSEFWIFPPKNG